MSVFLKFCVQLNIVSHFDFRFVTCWPIRFTSFHFYLPQPRVIISQPFTPQPSFRPARLSQGRHPGCKLLPPLGPLRARGTGRAAAGSPLPAPASWRLANETKKPQLTAAPQGAPTLNAGETGRQLQGLRPPQQFETASNEGATSGLPKLSHCNFR